jgi:uncharacterized protein YbjT (DUF2867 family)
VSSASITLLLAGATGLVGRSVLARALADPRVQRVVAPTRRPLVALTGARTATLENPVVDFDHLPADPRLWTVDAVVCALGTAIRQAGSQAAFRRVDHDYVRDVARRTREHGALAFALTSAMGADPGSRIFYNRVKGEAERSVAACGFPSLTIVRPGLIGGGRDESRPLELAAQKVVRAVGPLLPRRYRINPAPNIAHALLEAAIEARPGVHVVSSSELA